ncbi:hypothetical protein P2318_13755 [Myxococcaceae bacterium GXIMD 01537]
MTPAQLHKLDRELSEYLDSMTVGMGRTERRRALHGGSLSAESRPGRGTTFSLVLPRA